VVSFFSPSGYEHASGNGEYDLKIYLPHDTLPSVARFLNRLEPDLLVISKHDVWPNLVWSMASRNIPAILVNATLPADSFLLRPVVRSFAAALLGKLRFIAPASERDLQGFRRIVGSSTAMEILGDTRFDQVLIRSQESRKLRILPESAFQGRKVFVAGSIWPSDEECLLPALERLFAELPEFAAILVPHEPTPHHVQALTEWLERRSIPFLLFSDPELFSQIDSVRALVVDRIGVLANLYAYGDMAYVGGSFGPGVHNVMEPASHGIPVLFGPRILNSPEAQELVSRQAGIRIQNSDEAYRHLRKLLTENGLRRSMGKEAYAFVNANRGATQKTVEKILHFLGEQTGHTSPGQEPRG